MEGSLLKKTKGGVWHPRQFKLEGRTLAWLRSDDKTLNTVDIRGAEGTGRRRRRRRAR